MTRDGISAVLAEISHLLTQAEHSPMPAERAAAIGRLRAIRAVMEADLGELESGVRAGINRRVEIAALRSALSALAGELAVREAAEVRRTPKPSS